MFVWLFLVILCNLSKSIVFLTILICFGTMYVAFSYGEHQLLCKLLDINNFYKNIVQSCRRYSILNGYLILVQYIDFNFFNRFISVQQPQPKR